MFICFSEGEACNHIAALLWCLVDVTIKKADGTLASTSSQCKWNQPRKRKLSPKKAEDIHFRKVMKSATSKMTNYNHFSPASGKNKANIDSEKFRLNMLSILPNAGFHKMFPKPPVSEEIKAQCCLPEPMLCFQPNVDIESDLFQEHIIEYEKTLVFDPIRVEELTRGQRNNDAWELARKGRLTASNFGTIVNCNKVTSVVKSIMGYYKFASTDALEWGKKKEKVALALYTKEMKKIYSNVSVTESGLLIHPKYTYIGASPDGVVTLGEETGLVEIKCPFKFRHSTPEQAAENKTFFCKKNSDGSLSLKPEHKYFSQVQGQMALKGCEWCDFVVWTTKGMSIERIYFNIDLWNSTLSCLVKFFHDIIIPEVFTRKIKKSM
jgi:hypothetical protein